MLDVLMAVVPMIDNPLDGVVPDFQVFGAEFNSLWKKLLGAAWALGIIACVFFLIRGIVTVNDGQKSAHPSQVREGRAEAVKAAIALGVLAALTPIVGAILIVFGS